MVATLPSAELARRAARLRLVITDCDGVLTDAGVYYSDSGEALKRFSVRDGMGMELLRRDDVDTAILTRENSAIVARRAEKLRLSHVYLGVQDKLAHLDRVLEDCGADLGQLAYIGDDVNDLEIIEAIAKEGLTGAPADAMPVVRDAVHHCASAPGGHGAFRAFAEWLLALRRRT